MEEDDIHKTLGVKNEEEMENLISGLLYLNTGKPPKKGEVFETMQMFYGSVSKSNIATNIRENLDLAKLSNEDVIQIFNIIIPSVKHSYREQESIKAKAKYIAAFRQKSKPKSKSTKSGGNTSNNKTRKVRI